MVRAEGLEPPQRESLEPKSSASTNSATPAEPFHSETEDGVLATGRTACSKKVGRPSPPSVSITAASAKLIAPTRLVAANDGSEARRARAMTKRPAKQLAPRTTTRSSPFLHMLRIDRPETVMPRKSGAAIGVAFWDVSLGPFEQDHHGSETPASSSPHSAPCRSRWSIRDTVSAPKPRRQSPRWHPTILRSCSWRRPVASRLGHRSIMARGLPGRSCGSGAAQTTRIILRNRLGGPTSLDLHGLHVPPPLGGKGPLGGGVASGAEAEIAFVPPDSGTFWFHPWILDRHLDETAEGLSGVLLVEEENPPEVDWDRVVILSDRDAPSDVVPSPHRVEGPALGRRRRMAQDRHTGPGSPDAASRRQCLDQDRCRGGLQRCRSLRRGDRRAAVRTLQAAGRFGPGRPGRTLRPDARPATHRRSRGQRLGPRFRAGRATRDRR